jgi:hypothetical protein
VTRIGGWVRSFGAFWWDFIVGDDWVVAAGVIVALAVTALIAHHGISAWWLLPVAVVGLLAISVGRGRRAS